MKPLKEFIHFSCTSEDINNLAYSLLIKDSRDMVLIPLMNKLEKKLFKLSIKYKSIPMVSRTHGQFATPTTLGKEIKNFWFRIKRQIIQLKKFKFLGKINGSVGNYNSHILCYPKVDWIKFSKDFVESLSLKWNPYTTQIEPHDFISELLQNLIRFNTICIDICKDFWLYISFDYFKQKKIENEIGSSVMPHKINPINFENSEGNLSIANSLFNHFSFKLPISRLQRDLTDSTTFRSIGVSLGYSVLAYKNILRGINRIEPNKEIITKELSEKWELLCEAIQMVMRKYKIKDSYKKLKNFSRGNKITKDMIKSFINKLNIPNEEKNNLLKLNPKEYIGLSKKLVSMKINNNIF